MKKTKLFKNILKITILVLSLNTKAYAQESIISHNNSDTALINYLNTCGVITTKNNELKLLKSGEEKFIDLFAEIEKAKHHIHLEYFNFRNDSIANLLFDVLGRKASEGVKVRAIFDAFGNSSNNQPLKKKHLEDIRKRGIEIVKFDPIRFPWINHAFHRDHRKIAIIDSKTAYTGGMNIADYYINGLPEIGEWRDMHIRIKGDAVNKLQDIFLEMWNKCTNQEIGGASYYPYKHGLDFNQSQDKEVAVVDRYPRKNPEDMRNVYATAIETAEKKVQIINPYFTPTRPIKKAIKKSIKERCKSRNNDSRQIRHWFYTRCRIIHSQ